MAICWTENDDDPHRCAPQPRQPPPDVRGGRAGNVHARGPWPTARGRVVVYGSRCAQIADQPSDSTRTRSSALDGSMRTRPSGVAIDRDRPQPCGGEHRLRPAIACQVHPAVGDARRVEVPLRPTAVPAPVGSVDRELLGNSERDGVRRGSPREQAAQDAREAHPGSRIAGAGPASPIAGPGPTGCQRPLISIICGSP